jgi:peroxiredoxin
MDRGIFVWLIILSGCTLVNMLLILALVRRLAAGGSQMDSGISSGLKAGVSAPDFVGETLDGQTIRLVNYTDRSFVLLFVSPSCGPCRDAIPIYENLHSKAKQAGVDLILVSVADISETRTFANKLILTTPLLVAPSSTNPMMEDYKVVGTPSYCLVGEDGFVQSAGFPDPQRGPWKDLVDDWESHTLKGLPAFARG